MSSPEDASRGPPLLAAGAVGFVLGAGCSGAYLALGGSYSWIIPLWARVAFFPGIAAGHAAYDRGVDLETAKLVGVLAVGATYALVAVFLEALSPWSRFRR